MANELAKARHDKDCNLSTLPHEHAHSTPYYLHKDKRKNNMICTSHKEPILQFKPYLQNTLMKYIFKLLLLASQLFINRPMIKTLIQSHPTLSSPILKHQKANNKQVIRF